MSTEPLSSLVGKSGEGNGETAQAARKKSTAAEKNASNENNQKVNKINVARSSDMVGSRRRRRVVDRQTDRLNKLNRNIRKLTRIVPWRNKNEHDAVGVALLSVLSDEQQQQQQQGESSSGAVGDDRSNSHKMTLDEALLYVSMWKMRLNALEGLPHAIESTAALAHVYHQDLLQQQHPFIGPSSNLASRLAYSSAITRCVNGFADSLQQKRSVAASVSELCRRFGIPTWVVDVRHEGSHNNLPTLPVLRIAATTLLKFLQAEYWTPFRSEQGDMTVFRQLEQNESTDDVGPVHENEDGNGNADENSNDQSSRDISDDPIQLLIEYKKCAVSWYSPTVDDKSKPDNKNKKSNSGKKATKPATKILPYDPLFGEVRPYYGSVDDDDSDDEDDDGGDEDDDDWDDPTGGAFWGSSINTTSNRYALLEPPKKKAKKRKVAKKLKKKKVKANIFRFRQNCRASDKQKSPHEYAILFTSSVTPLEGYLIALRFLVWGGVGGSPVGRGVLIPGSERAFPSNKEGSLNCLFRYAPLIHGICRSWPGFAIALLVHLTDFMLSIEYDAVEALAEGASGGIIDLDPGSARKLFFLSLWIRFLLSQRFVESLESKLPSQEGTRITSNWLDIAMLEQLQDFGYPLHSLKDRFVYHFDEVRKIRKSNQTKKSSKSRSSMDGLVSGDILASLEELLPTQVEEKSVTASSSKGSDDKTVEAIPMSLDDLEELLSGDPSNTHNSIGNSKDSVVADSEAPPRQAWIRCETWDPCTMGTMPGYPT